MHVRGTNKADQVSDLRTAPFGRTVRRRSPNRAPDRERGTVRAHKLCTGREP